MENTKLCACSLGCAFGLIWGVGLLCVAWFGMWFGYGMEFIKVMESIYLGYAPSYLGGVLGFVWGFADAFVGLWVMAFLYNRFCGAKSKCCQQS